MNICFVSDVFPPYSIGGIERYLLDISRTLKNSNKIFIVTSSSNKNSVEKKKNLTIYRQTILDKTNTNISPEKKSKRLFNFLTKLVNNQEIDIIEAENLFTKENIHLALSLNQVSFNTNIPLILKVHGPPQKEIDYSTIKYLSWKKIIGVSQYITEKIYNFSVPIEKLATIYPGVDTNLFKSDLGKGWLRSRVDVDTSEKLILTACRLVDPKPLLYKKGIITLLKAISIISPQYKNIKLLIAAAHPPSAYKSIFDKTVEHIFELSKLYNIEGKVIIHSFNLEEMPHVYNGSDIFALATEREAFGLVFAEAMACSIPVIGSEIGGVPEVIENGVNGYLIHPNNPVELAKRLIWLLDNPSKSKSFGEEGRERVLQKFDLKKINEKLLGTFKSTLIKKR